MHKVLIGALSFNDLPFLRESMPMLEQLRQSLPADVAVMDTAGNDEIRDFFKKEYPHFHYMRHPEGNIGYGRAHSELLRAFPGYKYYLAHTSDVLMEPATVKEFVQRMEKDETLSMVAGKLYHWDFKENLRTRNIDSLGIEAEKRHHFYDRGHGEEDRGQYDEILNDVFGISGAVFLIRTQVIPKLHGHAWELFDRRMWMYKEDIDLSYRLRWLGEKIHIFPEVWGWHARTVSNSGGQGVKSLAKAQKEKRDYARIHSYKNHFLLLKNNFSWRYGLPTLLKTIFFEILKAGFMLLRHPSVFFAGFKTLLFVPGRSSDRRVSAAEVLSYFK